MLAGCGVNQLRDNANPLFGSAHAAFQDIAHAHLTADVLHLDSFAFVGKRRRAGDDKHTGDAGKCSGNLFGHAVAEILLCGVSTQIDERQDDDGGFVGQRQRRLGVGCWELSAGATLLLFPANVDHWTWNGRGGSKRSDKSKPSPMDGLNVPRRFGVILQIPAQFSYTDRQRDIADHSLWPYCGEEFILRYQTAWVGNQIVQHRKGFRRQPDHFRPTPDASIPWIEPKDPKTPRSLYRHTRFTISA